MKCTSLYFVQGSVANTAQIRRLSSLPLLHGYIPLFHNALSVVELVHTKKHK